MSASQAAAITACTACAAVGGAAAGGAFSGSSQETLEAGENQSSEQLPTTTEAPTSPKTPITYTFLSEEQTAAQEYTEGMVGKKYEDLLVGTYGKTTDQNRDWWNEKFKVWDVDSKNTDLETKLSTNFRKTAISVGFKSKTESSSEDSLNKACNKLYKLTYSTAIENAGTEDDKSKNKRDLWKYCSEFETAPVTVKEKTDENTVANSIGKAKEESLLSTTATENKKFWDFKNKQFKALTTPPTEKIFKEKFTEVTAGTKELKDLCAEAYKVDKTQSADKPSETEVEKYCSFKKIV